MAPWNIAFKGGKLVYIDYDTRDIDLTKLVPMAYQVMAALMNLERTVRDFGHCPRHAKNAYNIPFVSHCVGNNEYEGPCTDDKFPVACADHSCRETYVQCLQALHEKDVAKQQMRERALDPGHNGGHIQGVRSIPPSLASGLPYGE